MSALRQTLKKPRQQRVAPPPRHPKKTQSEPAKETADQTQQPAAAPAAVTPAPTPAPARPEPAPEASQSTQAEVQTEAKADEPKKADAKPENPAPEPAVTTDTEAAGSTEAPDQGVPVTPQKAAPVPAKAKPVAGEAELPTPKVAWVMPEDNSDPDDATALYVSPTVAKIPVPVMRRFNIARRSAVSHTAPVLDAMFGHAHELDRLILKHRPEIAARYASRRMPLRRLTAEKATKADLRIRPTEAELNYLKALVNSINVWLEANWPKTKPTDQSEVITVLLDAYLPATKASKEPATK
uniref:hypothetical protein n=1 Tax=Nocardia suismassiliense TaxID=2077092 RepID=UPI003F49B1A3